MSRALLPWRLTSNLSSFFLSFFFFFPLWICIFSSGRPHHALQSNRPRRAGWRQTGRQIPRHLSRCSLGRCSQVLLCRHLPRPHCREDDPYLCSHHLLAGFCAPRLGYDLLPPGYHHHLPREGVDGRVSMEDRSHCCRCCHHFLHVSWKPHRGRGTKTTNCVGDYI